MAGAIRGRVACHVNALKRQRIRPGDVATHDKRGGAADGDKDRTGGALALHVTRSAKHLIVAGGAP